MEGTAATRAPGDAPPLRSNPFPGPAPYHRSNEADFFGRDDEIEELVSLVLTSSATLVYAPSGAGKSSLLEAGVVPALERDFDFLVLPTVHFGTVTRGLGADKAPSSFVRAVCESIAGADARGAPADDMGSLAAQARGASSRRVLLVLDQFEELFNDPALWEQREAFFRALAGALTEHPWLRAVIGLRSDYLADLVPYEPLLPGRLAIRYQLDDLTGDQASEAIQAAFRASRVALPAQDLGRLLDRLLEEPGAPGGRGQHVNAIQLQIVCRRLWQHLCDRGGDGPPVLGDDFSVQASIVRFVDDAIRDVVSATQGDETYIRWWLETHLVTSANRRAFVLTEEDRAEGLAIGIVESLEAARLLQFEQRRGFRLVELTHDSMVDALLSSNEGWRRTRARRRHRVATVLGILLALVAVGGSWFLLSGADTVPSLTGPLRDDPAAARFTGTGPGALVTMEYLSGTTAVDVTVVEAAPGASGQTTVASQVVSPDQLPLAIPVKTREGADYQVALHPHGPVSPGDSFSLTVGGLAMTAPTDRGRVEVTDDVGIPVSVDTVLRFPDYEVGGIGGVEVLAWDEGNGWAVVHPSGPNTIALVSLNAYGGSRVSNPVSVTWDPVGEPTSMQLGRPVRLHAEKLVFASFASSGPAPTLAAEASCGDSVQMYPLTAGAPAPRDPSSGSTEGEGLSGSGRTVLPLGGAAGPHVFAVASSYGSAVDCTVTIGDLGRTPLTQFGAHVLDVDGAVGASAYAVDLPAEAVLVAPPSADVVVTPVCRDAAVKPGKPSSQHVLAYLPRGQACVLWISSSAAPPPSGLSVWLAPAGPSGGG